MKKITEKLLACILASFALLMFSCSNSLDVAGGTSGTTGANGANSAYLSLSIGENDSRTALPEISASDFDEFILQGKIISDNSEDFSSIGTWAKTAEKTAYEIMQSALIEIAVGNWDFKLTAKKNGAIYEGALQNVEVLVGLNEIEFTVELISVGGTGSGSGTGESATAGSIEIKFTFDENAFGAVLPYYVADLFDTATSALVDSKSAQIQDAALTITYSSVLAGSYYVRISFYEDEAHKLYVGGTKEYAHVIGGTKSSSIVEIGSLDKSYTITYYDGSSAIENPSFAGKFTRHDAVRLPNADEAAKDGYVFCGWYATSNFEGDKILSIPENEVGNKEVYANYMSLNDVTPIVQVAIEGTKKVGETLKAVPYISSKPEASLVEEDKFNGAVENYEWFLGEDANSDGTISESEWTSCGTQETYQITKEDLGKVIKASVTQTFTVDLDSETDVYVIQTVNGAVTSEVPETITAADKIASGTLNASSIVELISGDTFSITYDMSASFDEESVVMGSALSDEKIIVSPAQNNVKDSCGNDVPVTFELLENEVAPNSSSYVDVLVKSEGYEDYLAEDLLFITVREKVPSDLDIQVQLLAGTEVESSVTYGYVKFASVTSGNETLEYALTNAADSVWHAMNADEFKNGEASFTANDKIYIRRKATVGTTDENGNPVGYIAPSEAEELAVADANIGKKNAIKGSNVSLEEDADIAVTSNVDGWTVTLSITDYEKYENVVWETDASILGLTENLTVTPTMSEGVCIGATVTCAAGRPGTYSIVLSAKDKTTDAVYSTTINVTFSE